MAKKVRTPEEVQARLEKKAAKRKLFFGTFTKALAFFLAIAMVYSLAIIAFTPATVAPTGNNVQSGNTSNGFDEYDDGSSNVGTGDAGTNDAGNAGNTGNAGNAQANNEKAEFVKLINSVTAAAAKGSYSFERNGKFIEPIDVGDATDDLNGIVQDLAPGSDLDTIVGGFLGIKAEPIKGTVTNGKGEGFDGVYMIKGMTITESDITSYTKDGNKHIFGIKKTNTPTENSPLGRATNDYVTFDKVNAALKKDAKGLVSVDGAKSKSVYDDIKFTATIVDGKLTELEYYYTFSADLSLKILIAPANGTGKAEITNKYTSIKY